MKRNQDGAIPEKLARKIKVIEVARRGLPNELSDILWDLEAKLDEAEESGEKTSELLAEMEKAIDKERKNIKQVRKDYSIIRKHAIPAIGGDDDRLVHIGGGEMKEFPWEVTGPHFIGDEEPECNDFTLKFVTPYASTVWGTDIPPVKVVNGYAGWSSAISNPPALRNINGDGRINGTLELKWYGIAPADDVYFMSPEIVIYTAGLLFADGYIKPGVDARAYADIQTLITVGDNVLLEDWFHVGFEESRICPGTEYYRHFFKPANFRAKFWAAAGQEVRISIRFLGSTWTRGKGDAEVEVDFFGVLCNTIEETDVPVIEG